jgi:hypothetical protein
MPTADNMAAMVTQLTALTRQLESLQAELRALRAENALLQQQVAAARGVHQHQPYASFTPSPSLPLIEPPKFAFTPPRPSTDGRQPMSAPLDAPSEAAATSPDAVEAKRPRLSDTPVGAETQDATMTDASSSAPVFAGARRALSLGPHEAHGF